MSEIFLVGRPNVGKSFLFNRLSNSNQKIGNFAGVTVEKKSKLLEGTDHTLSDLPGFYSLNANSTDEAIALKYLKQSAPDDLICLVIECLKLKSQINFILEIRAWCAQNHRPLILVLNMRDEAERHKISLDLLEITEAVKLPVFFVSAKTNQGIYQLIAYFSSHQWLSPEPEALDHATAVSKINKAVAGNLNMIVRTQNCIDKLFLAPILGPAIFLFFTFILFQSIFSWAEPFMTLVEDLINLASENISPLFSGQASSFVENAVFAGFGAFLVFTPQIFILTLILSLLEKSGYMTRAILICHQPLSWFGLHGKSFIPLMTGHACAIPAIYASRNIESEWVRKLTIFVVPLTVCSARIPVYALLIKVLVPDNTIFYGMFGLQGFAFFMMYFFGLFLALIVSAVTHKLAKRKSTNDDFIIELPQYRWPSPIETIKKASKTTWDFIKGAGPTIFVVNAVVWILSYWPSGTGDLKSSYLASLGRFLEPVFTPIGLDWIQGVAVLSSFLAREIFVSTLGLLYGLSNENSEDVVRIAEMNNISLASGLSLLFFFAIALQCASTVSVMIKEGGRKIAYSALLVYLVMAYFVSFVVYQISSLLYTY